MDRTKQKSIQARITTTVFCVFIFGFAIITVLKPSVEFSETENRVLQQMPEVNAEAVLNGDFESDYEQYLTDQFVFRNEWVGLKTSVERLLLRKESKDIYFAKDGYFLKSTQALLLPIWLNAMYRRLCDFLKNTSKRLEQNI